MVSKSISSEKDVLLPNTAPFVQNFTSSFNVTANKITNIKLGSIKDAEDDAFVIKDFEVQNLDFQELDPELRIEVNPSVLLVGNLTTINFVLADLNLNNPKEQQYKIVVSVIEQSQKTAEELFKATQQDLTN